MALLKGMLVLLLFQCAGEAVKLTLELKIPGAVIGMALLFSALALKGGSANSVASASQTLIPLLGLMFLPAATGLFFLGSAFNDQWLAIVAAVVVGSIASLFFNSLMMKWLTRRQRS